MISKGPTLELRQRNLVKYSLQYAYLANRDEHMQRSKMLITVFALSATQTMSFKQNSYKFLKSINQISSQM